MKKLLIILVLFAAVGLYAQEKAVHPEYVTVRVQYGKTIAGFKYELYMDIGTSGAHSLSGKVTNNEKTVTIIDDYGRQEFQSDMDLLNYLAKNGWKVIDSGEIDILDQHYYTYLLERMPVK